MPGGTGNVVILDSAQVDRLRRVNVNDPGMWGVQAGTDFWFQSSGLIYTAGRTLITDGGWTVTSVTLVAGSGADFISKDDPGVPNHSLTNAAADLVTSPALFGDYTHGRQAAECYGAKTLPRFLICDFYAAFSVASADEVTTNIGLIEDGGSPVVAADTLVTFYSNSATFGMQANAAVVAGTTTVDNAWHNFRLVCDKQTGYAKGYIDGVYQNQIAITADEWPAKFGFGTDTTNRLLVNRAHIWYAWNLPAQINF